MSRNCPDNVTMCSQGKGPPRTSAFSVEPTKTAGTDSDEPAEVIDSLLWVQCVLVIRSNCHQCSPGPSMSGSITTCTGTSQTYWPEKVSETAIP